MAATSQQAVAPEDRVEVRAAHHRVAANILANWLGYGVTLAVGFFLAPLLVHRLGDVGYGVWALSLQVGACISILDLGVRVAVGRYLTHHQVRQEREELDTVLTVALTLLSALGALCLLVTAVVVWQLPALVHRIPVQVLPEARWTVFLIGMQVAISFPGALFSGAMAAISRYDLLNARAIATAVLRGLLTWAALAAGYGLLGVASVWLAVNAAGHVIEYFLARGVYSGFRFMIPPGRFVPVCRTLFSFSVFAFLLSLSSRLLLWSDNLVIGIMLGPAAVTFFAIAASLIDYVRTILQSATSVFVPLATALDASDDRTGLQRLYARGSRLTLLLILAPVLAFFIVGKPFITLWVGTRYADLSSVVLTVLSVPVLFAPLQATCNQILYGMNRHRLYSLMAVGEALAHVTLCILLARHMGVIGVAWGTLIPALVVEGILLPVYTAGQVGVSVLRVYWESLLRPLLASAPYVVMLLAGRSLVTSWHSFVAVVSISCLGYAMGVWWFAILRTEREQVTERLRAVFSRRLPSAVATII